MTTLNLIITADRPADGDPFRQFEIDGPDHVLEALKCQTCRADILAIQQDEDEDTVTLVTTHFTDCRTYTDSLWQAVGEVGR